MPQRTLFEAKEKLMTSFRLKLADARKSCRRDLKTTYRFYWKPRIFPYCRDSLSTVEASLSSINRTCFPCTNLLAGVPGRKAELSPLYDSQTLCASGLVRKAANKWATLG